MSDYTAERDKTYIERTRKLISQLPPFCAEYFRAKQDTTTAMTRYEYAINLRAFFEFLTKEIEEFSQKQVKELTAVDLDYITVEHIEIFMEHLSLYYTDEEKTRYRRNGEYSKARQLSAIRSFFKFMFKKQRITANVAALLDAPKLHDKAIIRLEPNEVGDLLDAVDNTGKLTAKQKEYQRINRDRDLAILTTFLGTGMRISELVGIDLTDIDFNARGVKITRKGGNQVVLYFGQEVEQALKVYLETRSKALPLDGHENALFLSSQNRRITPRAVQNLVKKYSVSAVPLKNITPHKLRSTFGTALYQETDDIYLVADVLGHSDVNTTKRHYAAQSDENRRRAARVVKLRD